MKKHKRQRQPKDLKLNDQEKHFFRMGHLNCKDIAIYLVKPHPNWDKLDYHYWITKRKAKHLYKWLGKAIAYLEQEKK